MAQSLDDREAAETEHDSLNEEDLFGYRKRQLGTPPNFEDIAYYRRDATAHPPRDKTTKRRRPAITQTITRMKDSRILVFEPGKKNSEPEPEPFRIEFKQDAFNGPVSLVGYSAPSTTQESSWTPEEKELFDKALKETLESVKVLLGFSREYFHHELFFNNDDDVK